MLQLRKIPREIGQQTQINLNACDFRRDTVKQISSDWNDFPNQVCITRGQLYDLRQGTTLHASVSTVAPTWG